MNVQQGLSMADSSSTPLLTRLMKSCIPADSCFEISPTPKPLLLHLPSNIFSLPDDILFQCLSRVSPTSLPSLSLVCRRFFHLLHNPSFLQLLPSTPTLFAFSHHLQTLTLTLTLSSLPRLHWTPPLSFTHHSQPRLAAIGPSIYLISPASTLLYNPFTRTLSPRAPTIFPRKKFAAAVISGRIYVSGGSARTGSLEEYDPGADEWRVVAECPTRRYGCVGAAAGGVFYVLGGLRVGSCRGDEGRGECAGSMDAYHVRAGVWMRARAVVPGGGCVVGACGAGARVYVLASDSLGVSFWRWDGKGRRGGDWVRLEGPPVDAGRRRVGGAVHFSCVNVGDERVLAVVEGEMGRGAGLLVYDIGLGEWSREPELPEGFRRAACVCVEC